jgi:alginate O-acetyltransferase complex protein AlgI
MIFLTYPFVVLGAFLFVLYYAVPSVKFRKFWIVASSYAYLSLYGGMTSVAVISAVLTITYAAGRLNNKWAILTGIIACVCVLIFYKYTKFLLGNIPISWAPALADGLAGLSNQSVPAVIPLGISFFTFEFVHYLVEVRRGQAPIRNFIDFVCFGLFWPTMVAGPIKRYQQFLPALAQGLAGPSVEDLARGLGRIAIGLTKKWAADNLTGWIVWFEPQFDGTDTAMRWLFIVALSARILLDFSGYSDIAIGFARLLGVTVPENFNWPYLARSPAEFWQRWHMSLSSWIRDYIYIPMGGNRLGRVRQIANGLIAMALCGLWHGPHWNFAVWGLYHGVGLAAGTALSRRLGPPVLTGRLGTLVVLARGAISWAGTMLFVGIGWLLFFYPLGQAVHMAAQLWPVNISANVTSEPRQVPPSPPPPRPEPPAGVAKFPDGLLAPSLFFVGTSQDGWLGGKAQVRLSLGGVSNVLHLTGEIPDFSPEIQGGAMTITVDGTEVLVRPETSGGFDLVVPIPPAEGTRSIKLDMTATDTLPPPDGRRVSIHLNAISLENSAIAN